MSLQALSRRLELAQQPPPTPSARIGSNDAVGSLGDPRCRAEPRRASAPSCLQARSPRSPRNHPPKRQKRCVDFGPKIYAGQNDEKEAPGVSKSVLKPPTPWRPQTPLAPIGAHGSLDDPRRQRRRIGGRRRHCSCTRTSNQQLHGTFTGHCPSGALAEGRVNSPDAAVRSFGKCTARPRSLLPRVLTVPWCPSSGDPWSGTRDATNRDGQPPGHVTVACSAACLFS